MLPINKLNVSIEVHNLAVANNVTDEQMASYIFRNFYRSLHRMGIKQKIHRHSMAIVNLSNQL